MILDHGCATDYFPLLGFAFTFPIFPESDSAADDNIRRAIRASRGAPSAQLCRSSAPEGVL